MKKRMLFVVCGALISSMLLLACGTQPAATPTPTPGPLPGGTPGPGTADWEEEWNRTLEAARQEGRVVITLHTALDRPALAEFERAYPGISVEVVTVPGREASARFPEEYSAGLFNYDVYHSGPSTAVRSILAAGIFGDTRSTFILPEVTDSSNWVGGIDAPWGDNLTKRHYFNDFANKEVVEVSVDRNRAIPELFDSVQDLLKPELQGNWCAYDPSVPGAGEGFWFWVLTSQGEEFMERLIREGRPILGQDERVNAEMLIQGEVMVCVGAYMEPYWQEGVGLHIEDIPLAGELRPLPQYAEMMTPTCCGEGLQKDVLDGTIGTGRGGYGLFRNAPHPNAAAVLINWLLTRDGQMAIHGVQNHTNCSWRVDMQEMCPEAQRLDQNGAYVMRNTESNVQVSDLPLQAGRRILGR